jgi:hypothetical protein
MKYRVFNTEAEAIAAEAVVAHDIGCAKVGTNAKTGLPDPTAQVTERWAVPQQISDGRWVFASPDDEGVEAGADWWPEEMELANVY